VRLPKTRVEHSAWMQVPVTAHWTLVLYFESAPITGSIPRCLLHCIRVGQMFVSRQLHLNN
jgi:hypothetical protein